MLGPPLHCRGRGSRQARGGPFPAGERVLLGLLSHTCQRLRVSAETLGGRDLAPGLAVTLPMAVPLPEISLPAGRWHSGASCAFTRGRGCASGHVLGAACDAALEGLGRPPGQDWAGGW